jgi:hypothetical protein
VTLSGRLPGQLEPEDWNIALSVFAAVREALPDASKRQPGEVMEFVLDAIKLHSAKPIENILLQHSSDMTAENVDKTT